MTPVGELCTRLDELGIEHDDSIVGAVSWGNAEYEQYCDGLTRLVVLYATPAQAIAATVDNACNLTDLWEEWERVLFANVQDEVAQDNLNNCVHALLDRAATMGAGTCRNTSDPPEGFLCSECGWGDFDEPTHILKDANFCPNCGARIEV